MDPEASVAIVTNSSSSHRTSFCDIGGSHKRNLSGRNNMWTYYRIYAEKQFKNHAYCMLCKCNVNYGKTHSTSVLHKHIERHHPEEYKSLMTEQAEKKHCTEAILTSNQTLLSNFMNNFNDFEDCVLNWIISTYQPLGAVEHESFQKMIASVNKKAPVIGYQKICNLLSAKDYDAVHFIKQAVKGKHVSITTDAWTSIAKEGYVTCTMHLIEPTTWTLHHFSLGIFQKDGASTARDVVKYVVQLKDNFGVTYSQLICVVTDTKSTMNAAGRMFKENSLQVGGQTAWHGCLDHKMKLVTKLAFKDNPKSRRTMTACRAIVTFFNSSSQARAKLEEKTKAMLGAALTVVQDVCTHWWSTFSMCEHLVRMKNILLVMHLEGDLRLTLSKEQWAIVADLTALLKPFMIAQRLLEGQSYITISLIPFIIYKIRSGLTSINNNFDASPHVRSVTLAMLHKFAEEFGSGEEHSVSTDHTVEGNRQRVKGIPKLVLMAALLDPRTKSAIGIPVVDRDIVWQLIADDAIEMALILGPTADIVPFAAVDAAPKVPFNRNNPTGRRAMYTGEMNDFLQDLNGDMDEVEDDFLEDNLQELIDATAVNNVGNVAGTWNRHTVTQMVYNEISLYKAVNGIKLRNTVTGAFRCPLSWWKVHHADYSFLSKLALRLLSIPATSAPSEHVFSTAGLTIAKDRARLSSDHANELVFLHDSLPAITHYKHVISHFG